MTDLSRRGFLAAALAGLASLTVPKWALALANFSNKGLKAEAYRDQYCLKIIARKGESYASISQLYTGSEKCTDELKNFNDKKSVIEDQFYYIPYNYLRASLTQALSKNDFSVFEIDEQSEERGIKTIFDVATNFLNNNLPIDERIALLIILNTDVNPITAIVYPGQKLIVPEYLVKTDIIEKENVAEKQRPIISVSQKRNARQNPFKADVDYIRRRIRPRDVFGARRIRGGGGSYRITKHTGLDLIAPIGTPLYPIEVGKVIAATKGSGRWWRNGKFVKYRTNSGLEVSYLHLSSYSVKPGQRIDLSTALGRVGITGNASANNPHVHIQIRSGGKVVNPEPYVVVDT